MKHASHALLVLALIAVLAAPLAAQNKERKKGKKAPQLGTRDAQVLKDLEKLELTTEQRDKIKTILASYKPKLESVAGQIKISPEQRRAVAEARKAAAAQGKKGRELQLAIKEAMKLSDDQIAVRKKQQEVLQARRKEIAAVLTAEQRVKLRGARSEATPREPRKKK